jgi:hypothetical protein
MACGKALNKQRVLNVGSTKALLLRFSLAAHLPVQDVARNAQVENFHTKEKALVETKNDSNLVGGGGGEARRAHPMILQKIVDGWATWKVTLTLWISLHGTSHFALGSVSSLNNPLNSEMGFLWKYEGEVLKIILIIRGYNLNNFTLDMKISQ